MPILCCVTATGRSLGLCGVGRGSAGVHVGVGQALPELLCNEGHEGMQQPAENNEISLVVMLALPHNEVNMSPFRKYNRLTALHAMLSDHTQTVTAWSALAPLVPTCMQQDTYTAGKQW